MAAAAGRAPHTHPQTVHTRRCCWRASSHPAHHPGLLDRRGQQRIHAAMPEGAVGGAAAAHAPPPPLPPLPQQPAQQPASSTEELPLLLNGVRVVLVSPKTPANIGAVLRVAENFEVRASRGGRELLACLPANLLAIQALMLLQQSVASCVNLPDRTLVDLLGSLVGAAPPPEESTALHPALHRYLDTAPRPALHCTAPCAAPAGPWCSCGGR